MAIELAAGDDRVVLDPDAGGRLTSLVAGDRQRLITAPPADADDDVAPLQWGAFVMAPWAGRIAQGNLEFDGDHHQLERNLDGHAIHGVVYDETWDVAQADRDAAVIRTTFDPDRWPFGGQVEHRAELGRGRLRLTLTVTAGDSPMPVWLGWHACYARPAEGDMRVRVAADEVLVTDQATIPTGELAPVEGDTDLRDGPPLGPRRLDHAYVRPGTPLTITWPDLELQVDADPAPACAVVFAQPHEVCVEPQTGWPDALRLQRQQVGDTGATPLDAHQSLRATTTWTWTTETAT